MRVKPSEIGQLHLWSDRQGGSSRVRVDRLVESVTLDSKVSVGAPVKGERIAS